jgi:shikimate dehydrogenase
MAVGADVPTMYFIGVTTDQSAMTRIFPQWAKMLGLDKAQLIGIDLPLQASREQYREVLEQVKYDPLSLGALITTHKIALFSAANDLFDIFDPYAQLCQEVSCISKRDGRLGSQLQGRTRLPTSGQGAGSAASFASA